MEGVTLAVDVVLAAIIGAKNNYVDAVIERARSGELHFILEDKTLFFALFSVKESDSVDLKRLAELLRYSQIQTAEPQYLGPRERKSWSPPETEIQNWREVALNP